MTKILVQTICNAFSGSPFGGNSAATIVTKDWLSDSEMQSIARKNNLPETTFIKPESSGFGIRWFTPTCETVMAGHATLAAAFTLMEMDSFLKDQVQFYWSGGEFSVKEEEGLLWMSYPNNDQDIIELTREERSCVLDQTGVNASYLFKEKDIVAVLNGIEDVVNFKPNFQKLLNLPHRGFAITAIGESYDYVSRFFCPRYGVPEDPVTGSSHAILARYWSKKLGLKYLRAWQCSLTGGVVHCKVYEDYTLVGGEVVIYSKARLYI